MLNPGTYALADKPVTTASNEAQALNNAEGIAPSRVQQLIVTNESGLYRLVMTSRKPAAQRFRKWETEEVLPDVQGLLSAYRQPAIG